MRRLTLPPPTLLLRRMELRGIKPTKGSGIVWAILYVLTAYVPSGKTAPQ
jgi:hypothetical protein